METFLSYRHSLWPKITALIAAISIAVYMIYSANRAPSGGTVVGLIYGSLGLLCIICLMYYGIRKRSYYAQSLSLQAWLSFHVCMGSLTLLLIPLHSGFHFSFNVHTLAYVLLVVVVVSGFVGSYVYLAIPRQFGQYGEELVYESDPPINNQSSHDQEYRKILQQIHVLARDKLPAFADQCAAEIQRGIPKKHMGWRLIFYRTPLPSSVATVQEFQAYLEHTDIPETERKAFETLTILATLKRDIESRLISQMGLKISLRHGCISIFPSRL